MGTAGKVLAVVAAIALPFLLLLDYYNGVSGWVGYSGADILITVLAVVALGLLAASFASDSPIFSFLILLIGIFLFAQALPLELEVDLMGIGAWLVFVAAFFLVIGAGMAILAEVLDDDDDGEAVAAPVTTQDPTRTAPTPSATQSLGDSPPGT